MKYFKCDNCGIMPCMYCDPEPDTFADSVNLHCIRVDSIVEANFQEITKEQFLKACE